MHDYLYDKKVTCVFCTKPFQTKQYKHTRIKLKKKDKDMCVHYDADGLYPYIYDIRLCPSCGMIFTERKERPIKNPVQREVIQEKFLGKLKNTETLTEKRTLEDGIRLYKLMFYLNNIMDESKCVQAGTCLRIAFLYRFKEDETEEKKYLENARDMFIDSYQTEDTEGLGYPRHVLCHLIAELSATLKDMEEAKKWFSELFGMRGIPAKIMNNARDSWHDLKEEMKQAS